MGCVSGQETIDTGFLESIKDYSNSPLITALRPDYKSFIPPAAIRRMSTGVKNSTVASAIALKEANVDELHGIITGTGMGCIQDSEKFLGNLINHDEEYLTPTSFIQSTHNTVAGQIALNLKSKAYNFTYVHVGSSFQSALLDGLMQITGDNKDNILVGGVDEIGKHSLMLFRLIEIYKDEGEETYNIFKSKTRGGVSGEGAAFFVLGNKKRPNSYAELVDVTVRNTIEKDQLNAFVSHFLKSQDMKIEDIDVLMLGNNGDIDYDHYYTEMESFFPLSEPIFYKHLFGEFHTAPAISVWLGSKILKQQTIPSVMFKNGKEFEKKPLKNVLIYNQFRGKDHSLILLKNV